MFFVPSNDWREVREVVVRVRSAENADAEEEVGVLDGVGDEAQLQQGGVLQCPRHRQLPASIGCIPRLSMNTDTRAFACASSPATNTSTGRPSTEPAARTSQGRVLNALTTCAPAGAALAISCAPELPSGVTKPVKSGVMGLVMSTTTLPCRASPYSLTTAAALA